VPGESWPLHSSASSLSDQSANAEASHHLDQSTNAHDLAVVTGEQRSACLDRDPSSR
jgi:hypothetical protein